MIISGGSYTLSTDICLSLIRRGFIDKSKGDVDDVCGKEKGRPVFDRSSGEVDETVGDIGTHD